MEVVWEDLERIGVKIVVKFLKSFTVVGDFIIDTCNENKARVWGFEILETY